MAGGAGLGGGRGGVVGGAYAGGAGGAGGGGSGDAAGERVWSDGDDDVRERARDRVGGCGGRGGEHRVGASAGGVRVYVADGGGRLAAAGVAGELVVAGAGLAQGYVGRADLTAERFVPEGWSGARGGRGYRTGDWVRWRSGGELEYVGRSDGQVKVRGYRVELGEVEARVREHGGVAAAAAMAEEAGGGMGRRVVCYVQWRAGYGEVGGGGELREWLRERVPEYLVPGVIVAVEAWPRLASGKTDRGRLAELGAQAGGAGGGNRGGYAAPQTPTEEGLAAVWSEVLGIARVGRNDNYFELGGDSIRGIQVISKARERGLEFTIHQLFTHPTIEEIAGIISSGRGENTVNEEVQAFSLLSSVDRDNLPEGVEDAYPLTRLQAGMIFHSELTPETAVYHDIFSLHLHLAFDEEAMTATLQHLIEQHEVLRTSFELSSFSEPLQIVHKNVSLPIEVLDISYLPEEQQAVEVEKAVESERGEQFVWTQAPLLRLKIYRRSGETFQLLLSFHHAILDGWSLGEILTNCFRIYSGKIRDRIGSVTCAAADEFR